MNQSKKQIDQIFHNLLKECDKGYYDNVIDAAYTLKVDYKQIEAWAKKSKKCRYILDKCHEFCNSSKEYRKSDFFKLMEAERFEEKFDITANIQKNQELFEMFITGGKYITMNAITEPKNEIVTTELNEIEKNRIEKWEKQKKKDAVPFKFKVQQTEVDHITVKPEFKEAINQDYKCKLGGATQAAIAGTTNDDYNQLFLSQAAGALFSNGGDNNEKIAAALNAFHGSMLAMDPQDIIEAQLCAKIIILNNQALQFANRITNPEQSSAGIDLNINRVAKLMRLHNEVIETLNRYRRKGVQTVNVNHVNVNSGGQAIVGSEIKNGVNDKK